MNDILKKALIMIFVLIIAGISFMSGRYIYKIVKEKNNENSRTQITILCSEENKMFDPIFKNFSDKNNVKIKVQYMKSSDIINELNNNSNAADAVWLTDMDYTNNLKDSQEIYSIKSIYTNSLVFAIRKSAYNPAMFIDEKNISAFDILNLSSESNIKFSGISNTESDSLALMKYNLALTFANTTKELTSDDIKVNTINKNLIAMFDSSDSIHNTNDLFNKDYVMTFKNNITQYNKNHPSSLYKILYSYDTSSLSTDEPFCIIGKNQKNIDIMNKLQNYLISNDGQDSISKISSVLNSKSSLKGLNVPDTATLDFCSKVGEN